MAALKENSKKIYYFVKEHEFENITAKDIAGALGLSQKQVDGSVTSAFCRKKLMVREEAERVKEDGTHEKVKYIRLTDAGRAFDPETAE